MPSFEDMVDENMVTPDGMRPQWAAEVITCLLAAVGAGSGHLTEDEREILLCLDRRIRGRLGEDSGLSLTAGGTAELLACAVHACMETPELDQYQPGLRKLAGGLRRELDTLHESRGAQAGGEGGSDSGHQNLRAPSLPED